MKKINLLLAALMVFSLASCGGNNEDKPTNPNGTGDDITVPNDDVVKPGNGKTIAKDARIGYQIFVDTFANGFTDNDMGNYTGDLQGIIKNLDFLRNDMHADVLWLTPIHTATTYTGYDVIDYESIREEFGTMDDYKLLLEEAHKRDMFVMLDLVINHTSSAHKWFKASSDKKAPGFDQYRKYYRWDRINHWGDGTKDDGKGNGFFLNGSYYYALFWEQMPDLNFDNPAVYKEMLNVCDYWLDIGVDGFRVDGAKHVYNYGDYGTPEVYEKGKDLEKLNFEKNIEFFNKFSKDIKKMDEDCFLTLEVLDPNANTVAEYYGAGVDSCFDFATRKTIIDNINSGNGEAIAHTYKGLLNHLESKNPEGLNSLILANHDMNRAMTDLNKNTNAAKSAAAVEMLLPGISWIYAGDELGMTGQLMGEKQADLGYRQRYKWGNEFECGIIDMGVNTNDYDDHNKSLKSFTEQAKDEGSMLSFYKDITKLKGTDDVFRYGDFKPLSLNKNVCSFTRSYNGVTYLTVINVTGYDTSINYGFNNPVEIYKHNASFTNNSINLKGYGMVVIQLEKIEGPDLDYVMIHYKGNESNKLYNLDTKEWLEFDSTDDKGNKTIKIDVKGKKLLDYEFGIGRLENNEFIDYNKYSYTLKDDGNKICHIYIDSSLPVGGITATINESWGFDSSKHKIAVWAWKDGQNGSWYEAKVSGNTVSFDIPDDLNKVILVIFNKNDDPNWDKKVKQTENLDVKDKKITTNITWK